MHSNAQIYTCTTSSSEHPPSMHAELIWTCRQLLLWHILNVNHACRVPVDSPQRFRIELLFSPGASFNPYEVVPLHKNHTLPVQPRACLHKGRTALHKLLHLVGNATPLFFSAFVICVAQVPCCSKPATSNEQETHHPVLMHPVQRLHGALVTFVTVTHLKLSCPHQTIGSCSGAPQPSIVRCLMWS